MDNLEHKIEAILFFKNEPVKRSELAKLLGATPLEVSAALGTLALRYGGGLVLVDDGELVSLGTHPDLAPLIEGVQKEELSRDLGRAGLETLAIILYKGPVSRREIDYIRGVNSSFILRSLLVRGLIERTDPGESQGDRSYSYKATHDLLRHLGVTKREDLPEFATAFDKIEEFVRSAPEEERMEESEESND